MWHAITACHWHCCACRFCSAADKWKGFQNVSMETWSYYSARFLQSLSKHFVDKKVDFRTLDSLNFITLTIIFQSCINQNLILFFFNQIVSLPSYQEVNKGHGTNAVINCLMWYIEGLCQIMTDLNLWICQQNSILTLFWLGRGPFPFPGKILLMYIDQNLITYHKYECLT